MRNIQDDLIPAQGILTGLKYSFILWAIIAAIAYAAYRW